MILLGAVGTLVASALPLAGGITAAAALGTARGRCLGCHMDRSVSLFRRLDIV